MAHSKILSGILVLCFLLSLPSFGKEISKSKREPISKDIGVKINTGPVPEKSFSNEDKNRFALEKQTFDLPPVSANSFWPSR